MELTKEEIQFNKMTKTPVKKLILSLSIPTCISMLVTTLYNIADTAFVSHVSTAASGAVSVIFPLMAIIQGFGFMFGMGAGSCISSRLGAKKEKEAQSIASNTLLMAIIFGVIFTILGLIFIDPLMYKLGATDSIFPHAKDYALYIIIGAPIMVSAFTLNIILRSEGKAKFSMIAILTGAILNIGLDPLFIYGFNMGTKGAAIATLIGQSISFFILLSFFIRKKSIISLSPKYICLKGNLVFDVYKVGLPSLARQGLASVATILLNNQARICGGDPAISAMGIVSKIFMVVFALAIGVGQGYQPVAGYNYAAKLYKRVKDAVCFTLILSLCVVVFWSILLIIFRNEVFYIFLDDIEVVEIGRTAVLFEALAFPIFSINGTVNLTFQSVHKKVKAVLLAACRQGIFFFPLVFTLPSKLGILGVQLTQPIADVLAGLFAIPFFIAFIKELNNKIKETEMN